MKLYVDPQDTSRYQQGMSDTGMIQVPSQYTINDLPHLQITLNNGSYEFYLDNTSKQNKLAQDELNRQVTTLYQEMNSEIYEQMANVFGTTNADSASAYEATWRMMKENPTEFSGLGLTARFDVAGMTVGDALDTDQKITDYATAKMDEVLAYGKYRMQRIEQFRNDRDALLG